MQCHKPLISKPKLQKKQEYTLHKKGVSAIAETPFSKYKTNLYRLV